MTPIPVLVLAAMLPAEPAAYRLNADARALLEHGKPAEAARLFRSALKCARAELGAGHPGTAMIFRNLALAYEETGRYDAAERAAKESLAILERAFGPKDVSLTPVLNVLGETYAAQGRLEEARSMFTRAIAVGADAGPHYEIALHNLAAVSARQT